MDALLLLFALVAIFGVLVMPMLRRHRERQEFERAAAAAEAQTGPGPVALGKDGGPGPFGMGPEALAAASTGLVPVDQLDVRLPGPDPQLVAALTEAQRDQNWRPAGQLLALTDDAELRWQRVQSLAGAAAMELARHRATRTGTDAGWLRRWRTEEPKDAGGAQVYAQFLVWQAMADPGSAEHRIILEEARTVCGEATGLAPRDPVPFITELIIARGLGYPRAEFEALWGKVRERDPQHMGAHLAALAYWSEKWHGSRAEADAFATAAAATAPEGSLLPALPLFSVYEHLPEITLSPGVYTGAVVSDAIEAAQYAVNTARNGHPVEPHVRHLLLCFLVRAQRYPEAAEQVRVVDGYVGAIPWVDGENPAGAYAEYRAMAIAGQ
ncbi:hypothetical protein [Streptomyces hoynatensis]|uniref:DUF4034 domain-containing protein n=1 Tax=Streptomyces hoynatensis TaxID=1141874 RepID=A0A3A9ZEZ7_9ACTN|nr:hypothetical protein [Streptomyces hoynatensis]RKN46961.1 hypothetical protein D7294_01840 [Streptomyces hoynatensis]